MPSRYGQHSDNNSFGGNSISKLLFDYLLETLPKGKTILELGSGWGTSALLKRWDVWSIEDNEYWFKKYNPQSFLVLLKDHAPIGDQAKNRWYDPDALKTSIEGLEYDLLMVDGPYGYRAGITKYMDLFDTSVPIIFDDVRRESCLVY